LGKKGKDSWNIMCLLRGSLRPALSTVPGGRETQHFDIEPRHPTFFRRLDRLRFVTSVNAHITTARQRTAAVGLPGSKKNRP
jgi:hypothetical protein